MARSKGTATDEVRDLLRQFLLEHPKASGRGLSLAAGLGATAVKDIIRGKSKKVSLDTHVKLLNEIEKRYPGWLEGKGGLSPIGGVVEVPSIDRARAYPVAKIVLSRDIPADRLVGVAVQGPAMEPTLSEGDLVVADTAVQELVDGAIYVIRHHGRVSVVRLRMKVGADSAVDLMYDNPRVPSSQAMLADFEIVGRVVAMTRAM